MLQLNDRPADLAFGVERERDVADVLAGALGVDVLRDRHLPGRDDPLDFVVIGSSGVLVVDVHETSGLVEAREVGGMFRSRQRLYVNGGDATAMVERILDRLAAVRTILGDNLADVPVRGALCLTGCSWGWSRRPRWVKGVAALWPEELPRLMTEPGNLGERAAQAAVRLREHLPT